MQSSFWHTLPALSCVSSHRRTLALERTDGGRLQKVPTGSWAGRGAAPERDAVIAWRRPPALLRVLSPAPRTPDGRRRGGAWDLLLQTDLGACVCHSSLFLLGSEGELSWASQQLPSHFSAPLCEQGLARSLDSSFIHTSTRGFGGPTNDPGR